ncbi:tetratricopeptide repeat protein [bacterium]|nr:tetratricopeptide repeat protein [candidate division CSSED10-310 bacterium]
MAVNKSKILKNAAKFTKKGQYSKAVAEYRKLTQEEYGDNSLNNTIGDLLIRSKEIKDAILEYEKAGEYYENRGFMTRALAIYKKILRHDPERTKTYQKLAHLYADQGLIQDAISQYEFLAKHYEHHGNVESALDSYRQIADLDPANISIRERLATLYAQKGFSAKAADERVKIGDAFLKRGEIIAAIKSFEVALADVPEHEAAFKGIVGAYMAEGRTGEARKLLDQILEKNPENVDALMSIGQIYVDNQRYNDAIQVYSQVYKIDPSQDGLTEILGQLYIQNGDFESAFKFLKEIINLAVERNNNDHALDLLNQLQGLAPENIPILERKIEIFQKLNRHEEVKKTFEEIAELFYTQGKLEESYNIYERLFSMDPQDQKVKHRFNQISIEFRGRPIDTSRLVAQPSFDGMKDEKASAGILDLDMQAIDTSDTGMKILELDTDEVVFDKLFETEEIEKSGLPVFMDTPLTEMTQSPDKDIDISDDLFTIEGEDEPAVAVKKDVPKPSLEPSDDQLREFRIEAGVYMKYGLLEKASERLNSILISAPNDEESLERLTEVYERMGQLDAMAETIDRRAEILIKQSHAEQAVLIIKNGLALVPGHAKLSKRIKAIEGIGVAEESPMSGDLAPLYSLEQEEEISTLSVGLDDHAPKSMDIPLGSAVGRGDSSAMATDEGGLSSGLAEVVREFREDLISREQEKDPETHYNLGIAYMEMGLIEEAIAEFQIALDFSDYMVKTASTLAHCYTQLGAYDKALAVLTRAIKNAEADSHEMVSLKYDLAQTMKLAGHQTSAITVFKEIQEETPGYRDVEDILSDSE